MCSLVFLCLIYPGDSAISGCFLRFMLKRIMCLSSVKCYIFVLRSPLWLGFMNDVSHEIFSCMIQFGMVPLFSSITVHSYDHADPWQLLLDLCEQSLHRSRIEILSYWLVYISTSIIDFDGMIGVYISTSIVHCDGLLLWGSCWQRCTSL